VPGNEADDARIRELEARIRLLESIVSAIRPDALPENSPLPEQESRRPVLRVIRGGLAAIIGLLVLLLGRARRVILAHPAAYVAAGTAVVAGITVWAVAAHPPTNGPQAGPPVASARPTAGSRSSHHAGAAPGTVSPGPRPTAATSAAAAHPRTSPSPSAAQPGPSPSPTPSGTQPAPSPSPASSPSPSPSPSCVVLLGIKVCV
jgi:hypothetical protein